MKQNKQEVKASITQVQQWSGPLPDPNSLARYNEVLPNAAERIMSMAEKEMEHRHQKEDSIIRQDEVALSKRWKLALLSTWLGFVCVIILSSVVGYALFTGADNIALGTAIGAIAAVAGLFTYSKIKQERQEK